MIGLRKALLPVTAVWVILIGASLTGFLLAEGFAPARVAATAAILLAGVKVRLVVSEYMEVGWQHRPLRLVLELWLLAVMAILLGGYWLG